MVQRILGNIIDMLSEDDANDANDAMVVVVVVSRPGLAQRTGQAHHARQAAVERQPKVGAVLQASTSVEHPGSNLVVVRCQHDFWPQGLVVTEESIGADEERVSEIERAMRCVCVQAVWLGDLCVFHADEGVQLANLYTVMGQVLPGHLVRAGMDIRVALTYQWTSEEEAPALPLKLMCRFTGQKCRADEPDEDSTP